MSRSEYKARTARQRSRSAKPYQRNDSNLVSKVKSWLTPSSWLSYLSPSKEQAGRRSRTNDRAPLEDHPILHTDQTLPSSSSSNLTNDVLKPLASSTDEMSAKTSTIFDQASASSKKRTISTADLRATLSMFESVLTDNQDVSDSSNSSWVAEDIEEDQQSSQSLTGSRSEGPSNKHEQKSQSSDEDPNLSPGVDRALTPVQVGGEEHTVQFVANPAFSTKTTSPSVGSQTVKLSQRGKSGFSADFSRRLYTSSSVVTTSTPQLSPVREQEEEMQQEVDRPTSPFKPVLPLPAQSLTLDQRVGNSSTSGSFLTPSKAYTNESISRSPFRSPFYTGRTSYGGAASHQKIRIKRPRTESSPPVLAPLCVSVRATPKPTSTQSVVSQTAKRIMDTLNSLTSPLSEARKMPLKSLPPEMQQAKRRRLSENSSSLLSPPPVTPLHSTKAQTPQIVPSELSSPRKSPMHASTSMDHTDSISVPTSSRATPVSTSSMFVPKLTFSTSQLSSDSSSSQTTSVLSGLKFTAPALSQRQASPENRSRSLFSGKSPPRAATMKSFHSGGKMPRRSRAARNRHPSKEEEEEEYYNPVAPPPQVGLTLGQRGSLPTFTFHSQLPAEKKSTPPKPMAATHPVSQSSTSAPGYSFSSPIAVSADSAVSSSSPPKISFGFSAPKVQLSATTATSTSFQPQISSSSLPVTSTFKISSSLTLKTNQAPSKPVVTSTPPLLKNMSVVDALKKPEYSQFLPSDKAKRLVSSISKSQEVVDLTNSDDEDGTTAQKDKPQLEQNKGLKLGSVGLKLPSGSSAIVKPFPQLGPPSGSWECSTCLVNNKPSDEKCVACSAAKPLKSSSVKATKMTSGDSKPTVKTTPFPGLAAPASGSWTCDTCLISNKPGDTKCAACTTPKPGAKSDSNVATIAAVSSSSGGFKLGAGVSLGGSQLKPLAAFAPPTNSWSCETCMVVNKPDADKCVACSASKPGSTQTTTGGSTLKLGSSGGFQLSSGISLGALGKTKTSADTLKSEIVGLDSKAPSAQWTCDSCWVPNKAEDVKCVACNAPKPGEKPETKKSENKTGLQLGSAGGFKLGGASLGSLVANKTPSVGLSLGSSALSANIGSAGESKLDSDKEPSKPASSILSSLTKPPATLSSDQPSKSTLQFGLLPSVTSTTAVSGSIPPNTMFSLGSKPTTDSPLAGIKLGGSLMTTTSNNPLSGTKLSVTSSSSNQLQFGLQTNVSSSSLTLTSASNPLVGIKLGSTSLTTNSPLIGIKVGGDLSTPATTASNSPLTGIKLGGAGGALSAATNSPLTGIKLGGALSAATNNPLPGIKLGGSLTATTSTLTVGNLSSGGLQAPAPGLPKLQPFTLGNTSTKPQGTFNFTGAQKPDTSTAITLQFTGGSNSAGSMFGNLSNTPGTGTGAGLNFTPSFGAQQSQSSSLGTPASDSTQAEMQSPDNEMNVEQEKSEQPQVPSLTFGTLKQQQPSLPSNIFGGQTSNPAQSTSSFSFPAPTTASSLFGPNSSKPSFNFGGSSSTSNFSFTASSQSQATELAASAQNSGLNQSMFASNQQSSGPSQSGSGFNFSGAGMNFNFAPTQQGAQFSAAPSTTPTTGRVIKKARRRKQ